MPRIEQTGDLIERERLRLRAPAKINLALHVTGKRFDGYHLLDSLVVFTELGDVVEIEPAALDRFEVEGPFAAGVPLDERNLVLRARDAFRARHGDGPPVFIKLIKNLPAASGIGGGSSDAAACLYAMAALTRESGDLTEMALRLGADLPMCLLAEPLRAREIGEQLDEIADFPALPMVLINVGIEVPTPEIFLRLPSPDNSALPVLPKGGLIDWLGHTRNDLQAPAIGYAPQITTCLDALDASGAQFSRMSGSGATCFGLYPDIAAARQAAELLRRMHPSWFIAATRSHAAGAFKRRIRP